MSRAESYAVFTLRRSSSSRRARSTYGFADVAESRTLSVVLAMRGPSFRWLAGSVLPRGGRAVSVTVFALKRTFRPELWPAVVPELDGIAASLADQLRGRAGTGSTVTLAGRRARRYEIAFTRDGRSYVERLTFVL